MERLVYLIRHGESTGNTGAVTEFVATIPLTKTGEKQSAFTADFALDQKPDLIVMSPFSRSQATAIPLIQKFPHTPQEIWPIQEFTYLSGNKYYQSTMAERKKDRDAYWSEADPYFVDGPGAESFSNFFDHRVPEFLEKIRLVRTEPLTYVFTHGQFMRGVILKILFPALTATKETMSFFPIYSAAVPIPNCAIITLLIRDIVIFIKSLSIYHLPAPYRTE